jgi:hypothetical protein
MSDSALTERATAQALVETAASTVATRRVVTASLARAWDGLMFYEQIADRPPLHLRLLLPVPIRTVGEKSRVGDEARCLYDGGHLIKRVSQVEVGVRYAFDVIEQALVIGGGMRLSGGDYVLREIASDRVEIRVTTRYTSPRRPRWLWRPIEHAVCHSFHRHILRAMQRVIEAGR